MRTAGVTITIPHYQTEELVRVCLRSIRKYTAMPYRVIVVDNGSEDGSLAYLRSVTWITLIERGGEVIKPGAWAHGSALDIGLKHADTEFFLALHSDVFIRREGWLDRLAEPFQQSPTVACAGAGKLEMPSSLHRVLKKVETFLKQKRASGGRGAGPGNDQPQPEYVRTTCALYRTAVLRQEGLSFMPLAERGWTSGQALYYALVQRGYDTRFISPEELGKDVDHVNHGTMVLNPSLGARKRTIAKGMHALRNKLDDERVRSILKDSGLDH
jgi:GT2 family glycosyltransferase